MKNVEVKISTADGKDATTNAIHIETKRGDAWTREELRENATNSGTVEKVQLRPGQRLVIDPFPVPEMVYDRDQGAAIDPTKQKNEGLVADKAVDNKNVPTSAAKQEADRLNQAANMGGKSKLAAANEPPPPPTKLGGIGGTNAPMKPPINPNPAPQNTNESMKPAGTEQGSGR